MKSKYLFCFSYHLLPIKLDMHQLTGHKLEPDSFCSKHTICNGTDFPFYIGRSGFWTNPFQNVICVEILVCKQDVNTGKTETGHAEHERKEVNRDAPAEKILY